MQPLPNPSPTIAERNSYDFRLVVSRTLYDQAAGTVHSPSLLPLVESAAIHVHPLDLDRVGAAEGASVRVSNLRGSTVMKLAADTSVVRGTAWVPFNRPGTGVGELIDCFADVNDVRIETL
jgi:predicted molibdopterin-dependent oxidoreductase YjgC